MSGALVKDIAYVRIVTSNFVESIDFAVNVLGLEISFKDKNKAYLRSDDRYCTICYEYGVNSEQVVGFEIDGPNELRVATNALEERGVPLRWGTREECAERHVEEFISFSDPSGNMIEMVTYPEYTGRRHYPSRDAGITKFSHVGLFSKDPRSDQDFWCSIFNGRVSDWAGQIALLRFNEVHHTLALTPREESGIHHINFQVESIDDVMRSYYFLRERGTKIIFGPGRHPTSSAVFLYFQGPDNLVYEYSCGVRSILDEEGHRPRQFSRSNWGACLWGARPNGFLPDG
ncbi:oxidoreductase [gamma proteobacterium BDW918]|jgi:2,3-dihydroxy-p-cumate/2,3-dihydroxybenzoate 3,4-dioxygenase|nr:oxidoreductase [gamma proteobacterium BDW918]|tara:strand:- start:56216 stop:57079 length:864 start_codon:yes stop_codon:yes gene_type:complete